MARDSLWRLLILLTDGVLSQDFEQETEAAGSRSLGPCGYRPSPATQGAGEILASGGAGIQIRRLRMPPAGCRRVRGERFKWAGSTGFMTVCLSSRSFLALGTGWGA